MGTLNSEAPLDDNNQPLTSAYEPTSDRIVIPQAASATQDPQTGRWYGPLQVSGSFSPPANQRVSSQANDFVAGSIVDLATLLTLAGSAGDANTVASLMGRLTKIRDLLNATLTVQGTITEANSAAILADLATLAGAISGGRILTTPPTNAGVNIAQIGGVAAQMSNSDGVMPANIPGEAQYIYSSGGPVDSTGKPQQASYDRLKSLQGAGIGGSSGNITATLAGDTALAFASAPKTIMPGAKIQLSVGTGNAVETVIISASYTPSSSATSIPLQFPVVNAGSTTAKWDIYAVLGATGAPLLPTDIALAAIVIQDANGSGNAFVAGNGISDGQGGNKFIEAVPGLYNGASFDRQRGNYDNVTLINASAVSSTQTSADQTNYNGRGLKVYLQASVIGSGSLVATIQGKDPVTGQYFSMLASAAITDTALHVLTIYPGLTASANAVANDILPRTWNVQVTGANGTTFKVATSVMV